MNAPPPISSPPTSAPSTHPSTRELWLTALQNVGSTSQTEIRACVKRAVDGSPESVGREGLAVRVLLLAGDVVGARRALADDGRASAEESALARAYVAGTLGNVPEALAAFALALRPTSPTSCVLSAVDLAVQSGAIEIAVRWAALVEKHEHATADDLLHLAELLLAGGREVNAVAAVHAAEQRADFTPNIRVAHILLSCRACAEAEQVFRTFAASEPAEANRGLATIALWRGDAQAASRHIERFRAAGGDDRIARRMDAVAQTLSGHYPQALETLRSLGELPERDAETRAWRAELLLWTGQPARALTQAREAGDASPDHSRYVALRIVEALCALRMGRRPDGDIVLRNAIDAICGSTDGTRVSRLVRRVYLGRRLVAHAALSSVAHAIRRVGIPVSDVDPPSAVASILELALRRMAGNRTSTTPTVVSNGTLARLDVEPPPRSQAEAALHSVRFGGPEEAQLRLAALIDRFPEWPHPYFYRAELMMWIGQLEDARRDLDTALSMRIWNPEVERGQWPRIGLAGVTLLQGDAHGALEIIKTATREFRGPPAQPYFAWHGEVLRGLGRLEEARRQLEHVCEPGSCRLGSLLTMALVHSDLGDRERPRQILSEVARNAPALILDVVEAEEREWTADPLDVGVLSDDAVRDLIERARTAMRGNRTASCVTFVDSTGMLRAIPPHGKYQFGDTGAERENLRSKIERL